MYHYYKFIGFYYKAIKNFIFLFYLITYLENRDIWCNIYV